MTSDLLGQRYPAPTCWEVASLEEVASILDSYREPINNKERQNRIDGKQVSELFPYFGATGQVGYIDDYKLNGKYVLLGEDGAPFLETDKAKAYIAEGKIWVNNHAHILAPKIDPDFFCYYLNSVDYAPVVTGTTRLKLNQRAMRKIAIAVPPLQEQRRIVAKFEELFSELDKGVENLKAARAQLKTYRQSLLKAAFEGRLTEQWRRDNVDKLETADQLQQRVDEEREARYQAKLEAWEAAVMEWKKEGQQKAKPKKPARTFRDGSDEVVSGDSVATAEGWADCVLGLLIDPPQYGTSKKCRYDSGKFPVLRIPNVANGYLKLDDMKYADFSPEEIEKWRLKEGDLLIVRSNGSIGLLGSGAMVNSDQETYLYAGYLMRLRPNPRVLNPDFLRLAFQSPILRNQIEQKGKSTSGVHNINAREISTVCLPLCSIREQEEVVVRLEYKLSQIDALMADLDRETSRADVLRQSILKRAFEGKLVPQDPDDEPASVLLERIRAEQEEAPKARGRQRKANA